MKFSRKATTLALALAMMASATTAFAAPGTSDTTPNTKPGDVEIKANGHTTISIMEATQDPGNVSFEVPLYVTMAVVKDSPTAMVPTTYEIKNTTSVTNGSFPIGVTRLSFEKLAGGWKTVAAADVGTTDAKNICLTINEVEMPAMDAAGQKFVNLIGSKFMTSADAYTAIAPDAVMKLPLVGTVVNLASRANTGAAAQFKVKYTISALDATGKPLGTSYVGDDRVQAGLPPIAPIVP